MPIVQILFALVIIGVVLYLIERFIPMDPAIVVVIGVVVILLPVLWLLSITGLMNYTLPVRGLR